MTSPRQPDPALGVFETLLVAAGEPVELDAHLARLDASLAALYGESLPDCATELARESAAGHELGRLRLTVAPAPFGLACDAVAAPVDPGLTFPSWEQGVQLRALPLPGGLGSHKWADRSRLPAGDQGTVPLLLDAGGEVLEAGWANVFAVHDGVLATPAADGRILPGVTRAAAIEVAHGEGLETVERQLGWGELLDADEIFLTGSVRGIAPARSLDGEVLGSGEVSDLLASRLSARWLGNLRAQTR